MEKQKRLKYLGTDKKKKTYSGTNNCLVTITETAGFDKEHFCFYLDLHNRYDLLKEDIYEGIFFVIQIKTQAYT
jgi:hypothetical protein